jgi:hypothetical protein
MVAADALINSLPTFIAGAGALGTACFGIVEGLKWTPLGEVGYGQISKFLGEPLSDALRIAYGPQFENMLRAQYRQDSSQAGLAKTLRQGVRIGLTTANAGAIAVFLGTVTPDALTAAAQNVAAGADLSAESRAAIGRFELAVDARIDAALSNANDVYVGGIRCTAGILALGIAQLIAWMQASDWKNALILGLVAVPFAPIANDLLRAVQAATKALKAR